MCYVVVHTCTVCTTTVCSMYDLPLCTIMHYLHRMYVHVYYIFTILCVLSQLQPLIFLYCYGNKPALSTTLSNCECHTAVSQTDFSFAGSLERKLLFSHSRYQQHFDLEGESGIVVRGIGTAVTVSKAVTSLAGGGATSPMFGSEGITSLRKQQ